MSRRKESSPEPRSDWLVWCGEPEHEAERDTILRFAEAVASLGPRRGWACTYFESESGTSVNADLVLLGTDSLTVVEVKTWGGEIELHEQMWRQTHRGKVKEHRPPTRQAKSAAERLASRVRNRFPQAKLFVPAVVFLDECRVPTAPESYKKTLCGPSGSGLADPIDCLRLSRRPITNCDLGELESFLDELLKPPDGLVDESGRRRPRAADRQEVLSLTEQIQHCLQQFADIGVGLNRTKPQELSAALRVARVSVDVSSIDRDVLLEKFALGHAGTDRLSRAWSAACDISDQLGADADDTWNRLRAARRVRECGLSEACVQNAAAAGAFIAFERESVAHKAACTTIIESIAPEYRGYINALLPNQVPDPLSAAETLDSLGPGDLTAMHARRDGVRDFLLAARLEASLRSELGNALSLANSTAEHPVPNNDGRVTSPALPEGRSNKSTRAIQRHRDSLVRLNELLESLPEAVSARLRADSTTVIQSTLDALMDAEAEFPEESLGPLLSSEDLRIAYSGLLRLEQQRPGPPDEPVPEGLEAALNGRTVEDLDEAGNACAQMAELEDEPRLEKPPLSKLWKTVTRLFGQCAEDDTAVEEALPYLDPIRIIPAVIGASSLALKDQRAIVYAGPANLFRVVTRGDEIALAIDTGAVKKLPTPATPGDPGAALTAAVEELRDVQEQWRASEARVRTRDARTLANLRERVATLESALSAAEREATELRDQWASTAIVNSSTDRDDDRDDEPPSGGGTPTGDATPSPPPAAASIVVQEASPGVLALLRELHEESSAARRRIHELELALSDATVDDSQADASRSTSSDHHEDESAPSNAPVDRHGPDARWVTHRLSWQHGLPAKLSDCSSDDLRHTELFIVEGDSALGTAKLARNARSQALLPIRGKILNTQKASAADMLRNTECSAIIQVVGAGSGRTFDLDQARYGKVILMSDADVDGAHIRCLLLTLIHRYMRPLLEAGRVFTVVPPLYRFQILEPAGSQPHVLFAYSEDSHRRMSSELNARGTAYVVSSRLRGLGELDAMDLRRTTMDPMSRTLRRITMSEADAAADIFDLLMGSDVAPRKEFIVDAPSLDRSRLDY